ncbi:MAG: Uma2 family endonuclease [Synechococcales bacterium]|nr:Uma2 family endonuclease [Synechococcales bacterium]
MQTTAPPLTPSLTLATFLTWPETNPAREFIAGQIIQKPMPQGKHSLLQTELPPLVNAVLKPEKIARMFAELRCTFGDRSLVPDLSVFRWENIPRDGNGEIANTFAIPPDWVIEILSPAQSRSKVIKKILACLDAGTEMGWLIDPAERSVFVYQPNQQLQVFDEPEDRLSVPTFAPALHLTIAALFNLLSD